MKQKNMSPRHKKILHLPKQILSMHDTHNLTEFVLHTLCDESCYNFAKAAYLIDNPDFDLIKGIAGFDHKDKYKDSDLMWSSPDHFTNHMINCEFNKKVRDLNLPSSQKSQKSHDRLVHELGDHFEMNNPQIFSWNIKYNNQGLLIFEFHDGLESELDQELLHGLNLLGFCPVF